MHKKKKTSVRRIVTGRIVSALPVVVLQGLIIYGIAEWLAVRNTFLQCAVRFVSAVRALSHIKKRRGRL